MEYGLDTKVPSDPREEMPKYGIVAVGWIELGTKAVYDAACPDIPEVART